MGAANLLPLSAAQGDPPSSARPDDTVRAGVAGQPAEVVRVIDGDTFDARVRVWPGIEISTKVRVRGIDTPELDARCAAERTKAEGARGALAKLLHAGGVTVHRVALDKYGGRVVADVSSRASADIGAALIAAGWARAYEGGRRQSWCDDVTASR
jgi:endonuclease YncB( thermonuclease family)